MTTTRLWVPKRTFIKIPRHPCLSFPSFHVALFLPDCGMHIFIFWYMSLLIFKFSIFMFFYLCGHQSQEGEVVDSRKLVRHHDMTCGRWWLHSPLDLYFRRLFNISTHGLFASKGDVSIRRAFKSFKFRSTHHVSGVANPHFSETSTNRNRWKQFVFIVYSHHLSWKKRLPKW